MRNKIGIIVTSSSPPLASSWSWPSMRQSRLSCKYLSWEVETKKHQVFLASFLNVPLCKYSILSLWFQFLLFLPVQVNAAEQIVLGIWDFSLLVRGRRRRRRKRRRIRWRRRMSRKGKKERWKGGGGGLARIAGKYSGGRVHCTWQCLCSYVAYYISAYYISGFYPSILHTLVIIHIFCCEEISKIM